MRHKFPVLTVKKWLKSVYIYGSYRKNKIGVPFFWTTLYTDKIHSNHCLPIIFTFIE